MCDCGALDCPRCFPEAHASEAADQAVVQALKTRFAAMLAQDGQALFDLISDCYGRDRFITLVDRLILAEARQGGELAELLFAEFAAQHEDDIYRRITS